MTLDKQAYPAGGGPVVVYYRTLRMAVLALAVVAGLGVLVMMGTICLDVIGRAFGKPLTGAFDIVRIAGAITIGCGLPYTTAVKGHVTIEYFFLKLSRRGRIAVDTVARMLGIFLFVFLAWQSFQYGLTLKQNGLVSATLQIPMFWVPQVIALDCAAVALVILHNLLHPGKEMIKP